MKVVVVAEMYPRAHDPVWGIWAHRQAIAARDAGAEVRVVVLHRPIPPGSTPRRELPGRTLELLRQPRHVELDGIAVDYVRFLAPPRPKAYGAWGRWAAPPLALHLRRLRRRFPFDLVHAHNAVPAGDAVRRGLPGVPLVVSVHGGDVYFTVARHPDGGADAVRATFAHARLVLANAGGVERLTRTHGAHDARVVHLGTDVPAELPPRLEVPTVVSLGHLVGRKRQGDVMRALWLLRDRHPTLRHLVIGDGPERGRLQALAVELGVDDRVDLVGQLPHEEALRRTRQGHLFALPSVDEAFGVAYIEAMAGGLPAIACLGESGPTEIEELCEGMRLVPPGDIEELAGAIDRELSRSAGEIRAQGLRIRGAVAKRFSWDRCGVETVKAYEDALR